MSSQILPVYDHCTPEVKAEKGSFFPFTPILSGSVGVGCGGLGTGAPFSNGGGEACVQVPVLGGTENRISQHTRVQLNQFTKLTYRPTIQQCHMPKMGGRGAPGGRQLVPTPGCAFLLCHQSHSNFPGLRCPYLNRKGCSKEYLPRCR